MPKSVNIIYTKFMSSLYGLIVSLMLGNGSPQAVPTYMKAFLFHVRPPWLEPIRLCVCVGGGRKYQFGKLFCDVIIAQEL